MHKQLFILPIVFLITLVSAHAAATNLLWSDDTVSTVIEMGQEPVFHAGATSYDYPLQVIVDMYDADGHKVHVFFDDTVPAFAYFDTFTVTEDMLIPDEDYTIFIYAVDARGDESTSWITLHVLPVQEENHPPQIDDIQNKHVTEGDHISFEVTATDQDDDMLTFTAFDLPAGALFDETSGQFTWTPGFDQGDDDPTAHPIIFEVSDGEETDSISMTIYVYDYQAPNQAPVAQFFWSPALPYVYDAVTLDAGDSYDPDGDWLTYTWDLDDDGQFDDASGITNTVSFDEPGTYTVGLKVSDGSLSDTIYKKIIVKGQLIIDEVTCFETIIQGENQSCSAFVTDGTEPVGMADVSIYFNENRQDLFGTCTTNAISGGCAAKHEMDSEGTYTVYAFAEKQGYTDPEPKAFTFDVLDHRYDLTYFEVYADEAMTIPSYTFYRGEDVYVKFKVYDRLTQSYITDDVVSEATLVSNDGGGRIGMDAFTPNPDGHWFKFKLEPIPLTHDFIGDSNVFVFAFNFEDGSGGQAEKSILILNNLPVIDPIPDIALSVEETEHLDLSLYGYDLEDANEDLDWAIIQRPGAEASVQLDDDLLSITGEQEGVTYLGLELRDLDYVLFPADDYPQTLVKIVVTEPDINEPPVLDHIGDKQVTEGDLLTFTVTASDPDDDELTLTITGLPEHATFDEETGVFSWTPDYDQGDDDPTTYKVSFTVSDGHFIDHEAITISVFDYVEENQKPTATILYPDDGEQFLETEYITFEGKGEDPEDGILSGDSLAWHIDGSFVGPGNTYQTMLEPGVYAIDLFVTDSEGETDKDSITITVKEEPQPFIKADVGGPYRWYATKPLTVDASGSEGDIVSYHFEMGDGIVVHTTNQVIQHTYAKTGTYTITLTVKDAEGNTDTDSTTVTIRELPRREPEEDEPDQSLYVGRILLYADSTNENNVFRLYDDATIELELDNTGEEDLEDLRVTVIIPELGIKVITGDFDLDEGDVKNKHVRLYMYYGVPGYEYYAKIIVNNDEISRVKYRYFTLVE